MLAAESIRGREGSCRQEKDGAGLSTLWQIPQIAGCKFHTFLHKCVPTVANYCIL